MYKYHIVVILCLLAPVFGYIIGLAGPPGLKFKHGQNWYKVGSDNIIDLPLSNQSAANKGYIKMNRPRLPGGFCELQLWCRLDDYCRVCILTDETRDVAGVQINIPYSDFNPTYDMKEQGWGTWTTTLDHVHVVRFYCFFILFTPPDSQQRIDSKDPTIVLRDDKVHYSGFNRKMRSVAIREDEVDEIYKKKACIGWQGHGYFYNMTTDLECSSQTLSPFYPIYYWGELVATRVVAFGHFIKDSKFKELFEEFNALTTKYAIPDGPQCLFNLVSDRGGVAMTIFFKSLPWKVTCIAE